MTIIIFLIFFSQNGKYFFIEIRPDINEMLCYFYTKKDLNE